MPANGLRARVLLVEDEFLLSAVLSADLQDFGYDVLGPFDTLSRGMEAVTSQSFDGAILDINLKGEMGYRLMDWLHDRGIQVVVISGYEDLPGSLGKFAAILQKPFTDAALLTTLKRMMGTPRTS